MLLAGYWCASHLSGCLQECAAIAASTSPAHGGYGVRSSSQQESNQAQRSRIADRLTKSTGDWPFRVEVEFFKHILWNEDALCGSNVLESLLYRVFHGDRVCTGHDEMGLGFGSRVVQVKVGLVTRLGECRV